MAFWSGTKLKQELDQQKLIVPFDPERIDCAAYTLRMGQQYYLSASEDISPRNRIEKLSDGESIAIPSGQFAFLLTEETVSVPVGTIAFISMKTELKFRGLVNVSGFHVDPGFDGPLKFAVFNAGPATVCIKQGDECFLIWYADLDTDKDTEHTKKPHHNKIYARGIIGQDVKAISGSVRTLSVLAKKVEELERTQTWMKVALFALGFVATIVLASATFLSQEGLKSFLPKAAAWFTWTP